MTVVDLFSLWAQWTIKEKKDGFGQFALWLQFHDNELIERCKNLALKKINYSSSSSIDTHEYFQELDKIKDEFGI